MKIALIAGARPNFMKIAPLHAELVARDGWEPLIVHTGQHYDARLSELFFEQLGLPEPVVNFGVGSSSHARQTADVLVAFEQWCETQQPGLVVVVGDVNSTLAATLVAAKAGIPLAHVEAGLRSFDRSMPEEVNRIVVDALADLLFVSERSGMTNLANEGVAKERVHFVGNVMIDTLLRHREAAARSDVLRAHGLEGGTHVVVTLHRPSNVDRAESLAALLDCVVAIAADAPVVLPLHPRTRARIEAFGLQDRLHAAGLHACEPLAYLDFLQLMATARAVITDSGGIQEETTVLGVRCFTVRDNTERPATVEEGTNRLVGSDPTALLAAWREERGSGSVSGRVPEGWDGRAAHRIVDALERWRS